jgi:hypothetical protein
MISRAGKPDFISRWRRWREVVSFVDALFQIEAARCFSD